MLAPLARRYLTLPASTASVDRLFSFAKYLFKDERALEVRPGG